MPTRGKVTIETVQSLQRLDGIPAVMRTVSRMPVAQARNELAKMALRAVENASWVPSQGWHVLWIDDDAWWRPGTVAQALSTLVQNKESIDLLCGWFGPRAANAGPAVRKRDDSWPRPGTDCQTGDVIEIHRCGFHFVLHRLGLLERVGENPFSTEGDDHAEDYAFCRRVRSIGGRIWVHTGLPIAHIADDGSAYLPGEPAQVVVGSELLKAQQPEKRTYGFEPGLNIAQSLMART